MGRRIADNCEFIKRELKELDYDHPEVKERTIENEVGHCREMFNEKETYVAARAYKDCMYLHDFLEERDEFFGVLGEKYDLM